MRILNVAAAQLGPITRDVPRDTVVARLIAMLRQASAAGSELVVFPDLALTTFFPRWFLDEGDWPEIRGDTTDLVVRRGFSKGGEGGVSSLDLGDDLFDGLGPDEGLRVVVPV